MGMVVIGVLAVLSVPIMLIVALVKLSWIEGQLSSLCKKIEIADVSRNLKSVPKPSAPVKDNAEETEMKNRIEKQEMTGGSGVSPLQERGNVIVVEKRRDGASPSQKADVVEKRRDGASTSQEEDVYEKRRDGASPSQEEDVYEKRRDAASPSQNDDSYEPTAIDLFWMRVEDWFAVRGDFAPKGMTREFAFATRWLVRIGVALIVGAIIYFVKLSIDRGWMGPTGRVAATLFWGMVGCVGGSWLVKKERYSLLGHAIAALGVVALYLGFGLGHCFFDPPVIASPVFAFAALAGVTLVAGVMAVYLRSPHIAVMGLVGGHLVPVIAGRDSGFPLGLDAYLLVLNLGAFYVSRKRLWSALDFLASMLAFAMCWIWTMEHAESGGLSSVMVNLVFLSVVHALYMTGVIVGSKTRGKVGNAVAWAGLCINAVAYFAWLAVVFRESFSSSYAGLILLGLVAAYLAVATLAIRRGWADRATVNILLVFALAFLAISPVLLFGKAWWAVSWAAIAVAASEAEIRSEQKILGILSWVILIVASFATLFHFAPLAYCQRSVSQLTQLSGGEYFSEFALRLVRLWSLPAAAAFIAYRRRVGPIAIAALAVTFIFFTGEVRIFGYVFFPSLKTGTVSVAWLLAAFAGLWAGIVRRSRATRITALSLLGVSVVKVLLMDTARLATPARVGVFALAGVLLIIGAFLYMKFKERFEDHA